MALSVNQYLFSSDSYEPCEDEMRLIPLSLHSKSGNTEYALAIEKLEGDGSLAFLYYDTGNVDAYKDGSLTGLKNGKKPDLCFIVLKVL